MPKRGSKPLTELEVLRMENEKLRRENDALRIHLNGSKINPVPDRPEGIQEQTRLANRAGNIATWDWDITADRLSWDDQMYKLFGYVPDDHSDGREIIAKSIFPEDFERERKTLESALKSGPGYQSEYRIRTPEGTIRYIHSEGTVMRDQDGNAIRMVGISQDFTWYYDFREKQQEELRIQAILNELLSDCVVRLDLKEDGTYHTFLIAGNFRQTTGLSTGVFLHPYHWRSIFHPDDLPFVRISFAKLRDENQPIRFETRSIADDGSVQWLEIKATPFRKDETAKVFSIYAGISNITAARKAHLEQKHNESLLKLFVEHSPAAIAMFDREMHYLLVSRRFVTDFHLEEIDLIGKSHYDVFPEIPENWKKIHRDCLKGNTAHSEAEPFIRTDGRTDWVHWEILPWYDSGGTVGGIILFSEVVTKRVEAEEKLRKSEERFRFISENTLDVIWVMDPLEEKFTYVSPSIVNLRGYTPEEVMAMPFADALTPESNREIHSIMQKYLPAFLEKGSGTFSTTAVAYQPHKNGTIVPTEVTTTLLFNKEGKPLIIGVSRDITERRKSEEKYRNLFESISDVFYETTLDGTILEISPSVEIVSASQYTRDELIGKSYDTFYSIPEERDNLISKITKEGRVNDYELLFRNKDGTNVPVAITAVLVRDEKGQPCKITGSMRDISARKTAEKALRSSEERFRAISEYSFNSICILNEAGKVIWLNDAMIAMSGYTSEYVYKAESFVQFLAPESVEFVLSNFMKFVRHEDYKHNYTFYLITANGDKILCEKYMSHYEDQDGHRHLIISMMDITHRDQAQMDLKQSEEELNRAQEIARMGSWEFNLLTGKYTWSRNNYLMVGMKPFEQEVTVEFFFSLVHPEDRELVQNAVNHVTTEQVSHKLDFRLTLPDGTMKWIQNNLVPVVENGMSVAVKGVNIDITKQKIKDEEIRELNSRLEQKVTERTLELEQARLNFQTFFNTVDDFIFITDETGTIIHTNETVNRRLGLAPREILGKNIISLHPRDRWTEAQQAFLDVTEGRADTCSVPLLTATSKIIPIECRIKRGTWNGQPVLFNIAKDISAIQLSEEKFSRAFHSNSMMMSITNFERQYVDVNQTFLNMLGYTREEVIGRSYRDLGLFFDPAIRDRWAELCNEGFTVRDEEAVIRSKSGTPIHGLCSADRIFIGKDPYTLVMLMDITARKKAEEELRKARAEADQANQAKSEFLSRMSHELRTPLNSILGFAQIMEMGEITPQQKKNVTHILTSGKHLLNLINEILDISRIEAGRLSLSPEPVQIGSVIREMMDIILPSAERMNVTLELESSETLGFFIQADRQRLKQVILNLLSNAVKYNHDGGTVMIKTGCRQEIPGQSCQFLRISVKDSGIGIRKEDFGKLFLPFERLDSEKRSTEGTGLGLAVVKKLVEAMGGIVGAESEPGKGSTFWFDLPVTTSPILEMNVSSDYRTTEPAHDSKGLILYIEDNHLNIELINRVLAARRPAIRLISETSGMQTCILAATLKPDLILLDLDLPDIHGTQVLEKLQADEKLNHIPVVIISAEVKPRQTETLLFSGARYFLPKPINLSELLMIIDEFIPGTGAEP